MEKYLYWNPKSTFPPTGKGTAYFALFIVFVLCYTTGYDSLKNPAIYLLFLYFVFIQFSGSRLEFISGTKYKVSHGVGVFRFGKIRDVRDYNFGVIKKVNQSYNSKRAIGGSFLEDNGVYVESFWTLNLHIKSNDPGRRIFKGEKKEVEKVMKMLLVPNEIRLFKGVIRKGYELKLKEEF